MRDFSRTIESFTTDLGTEVGIAKLRRDINLDEFVPGFTELFEDTEGAGHVDVEDTEGAGHADEECVIEFEPDDVVDDEVAEVTGDSDDEAELEPPVAPVVGDGSDNISNDELFFSSSLHIAGIMHILHNAVKDVTSAMPNFEWFWKEFKVFCLYMKHRWNRERVVGTCFSTPPASWLAADILGFAPDITDTRWGYLIATLDDMLDIESALRNWWDSAKVNIPARRRRPGGGQGDVEEGNPGDFVNSAGHWAYAKMLSLVNSLIDFIQAFAWSCPCHRHLDTGLDPGTSWGRRSRAFRQRSPTSKASTCQMRGRNVGRLAAGEVDEMVERHLAIAMSQVLMITSGLPAATRELILKDFENGHKHVAYIIRLKISVYQNNPQKVLSLGHPDIEVARKHCRVAYDLALAEGEDNAHPWILALVFSRSPLGHEFTLFVTTEIDFGTLRLLAAFRARVRLIPVVETYIEARHKDLKQEGKSKYRVSNSRASLKLRGLEIEGELEGEAATQFFTKLTSLCSQLRSMSGVLQNLGLATHAAVSSCIQDSGDMAFGALFAGHSNHALVEKVVYRRDPGSQFRNLDVFKNDVNPDQRPAHSAKTDGEYTSILHAAATEHFRSQASREAYYSHYPSLNTSMIPISMALSSSARMLFQTAPGLTDFTSETSLAEAGVGSDGAPAILSGPVNTPLASSVFFRVAHLAPNRQGLVSKSPLGSSDIMVCVHSLRASKRGDSAAESSVTLDLQHHQGPTMLGTAASDGTCVWSVPRCSTIGEFRRSLIKWQVPDASSVSCDAAGLEVPGVPKGRVQSLVQQLVHAGALPGFDDAPPHGWRLLHAGKQAELEALEAMSRAGLTSCVLFTSGHSEWHVTHHVVRNLRLLITASAAKNLFAGRFVE